MPEFIYTTSLVIIRPILIDAEKLESLDRLLNEEWERLTKRNQQRLNEEVEKTLSKDIHVSRIEHAEDMIRIRAKRKQILNQIDNQEEAPPDDDAFEAQISESRDMRQQQAREEIRTNLLSNSYHGFTENRSITIYLGLNKKVIVNSFYEALRQQELLDEKPHRCEAVLNSGDIKCALSLRQDGSLEISVSPEHLSESRELFASLQRWTASIRPPIWQRIWVILNPFQWVLWILSLWICIVAVGDTQDAAKRGYQEIANQILKDGVSQDEQLKAIETILALESKYVPPSIVPVFPGWFKLLFFGGFIACCLLSFTPRSLLGIGKGQESIKHWRLWMRIVFIIVPSFLFVKVDSTLKCNSATTMQRRGKSIRPFYKFHCLQ